MTGPPDPESKRPGSLASLRDRKTDNRSTTQRIAPARVYSSANSDYWLAAYLVFLWSLFKPAEDSMGCRRFFEQAKFRYRRFRDKMPRLSVGRVATGSVLR